MLVEVDDYDLSVVRCALTKRLIEVRTQLSFIRIAAERHLTEYERWGLPPIMIRYTQEELVEQINPWISLEMTLGELINQFTKNPVADIEINCLTAEQVLELTQNEIKAVRLIIKNDWLGQCAATYAVMYEIHPEEWTDEIKWPFMKGQCPEIDVFIKKAKKFGLLN